MEISAQSIEQALLRLPRLPTPVSEWQVRTGPDSTDDPAVWVRAVLSHDDVDADTRHLLRRMIRERVREEAGTHVLVYVRFPTASEMGQAG